MHISEGILAPELLAGGWAAATAAVAYGFRRMSPDEIPRVALTSAALFAIAFVRVPFGPVHLHLAATGLAGLLLGWLAVPALFVVLLLQAVLLQYGGLAVLGVNTLIHAAPAVGAYYVFRSCAGRMESRARAGAAAGVIAALAVAASVGLMALCLLATDPAFRIPAIGMAIAHLPLVLAEGAITASAVGFLYDARRDVLPYGVLRRI